MNEAGRLLEPDETCWRIERADRVRIIVDGADYFRAAKASMLAARKTIMMIGWDFDTRISFEPDGKTLEGPNFMGDFLDWLPKNREDVDIYMLKWDLGMAQSVGRGMMPMALLPMRIKSNFHFKLDGAHPSGAAHHSKIVVIDDEIAFCGGIDMTAGRWDTRAHRDNQPERTFPGDETPSKPWHDVTTAIAGPAAAAFGDLARQRWYRATSEELEPPTGTEPIWPDLPETFTNVPVALARTYPNFQEFPENREVEALYLRAIATAESIFYVETQYLASAKIARAIVDRLGEADGPEFVVILPEKSEGWLRQKAMDGARERLLNYIWANDTYNRFAAYYPVTQAGSAIYVHAKVLAVDDRLFRVGSSNLNNRSMGFDTECDMAIETAQCDDPESVGGTILSIRKDLLCEHLSVAPAEYEETLARTGSVIATIETLRGDGRSLRPFTRSEVAEDSNVLAENEFADPEAVEDGLWDRFTDGVKDLVGRAQEDR